MTKKSKLILLVLLAAGALISVLLLFGPPQLLARSSQPDFCSGCHVMEAEYDAWAHTGAHRGIKCVDCHLPNQNRATHYLWKSIDGLKDAWMFYSGSVSDRIELSHHARGVLQSNCIRCHETTVSMISTQRDCWGCHRNLQHRRSGTIETL